MPRRILTASNRQALARLAGNTMKGLGEHRTILRMIAGGIVAGTAGRLLSELEDQVGVPAKVELSKDNFRFEFYRDGKKLGIFRASTVTTDGHTWDNLVPQDCKDAWESLGRPNFWVIRSAEWFDPSLRGKGLGLLAYQVMIAYIKSVGGVVGPDFCAGEHTSPDAEKVWKKLRTIYRTRGPLVVRGASSGKSVRAARPIRIDRSTVNRVLDRMYRKMAPMGEGTRKEQIVGHRPDALVMDSIVIKDVFGNDREVFIAFTAKPGTGGTVTGGAFGYVKRGQHREQPIIIIQLNGNYTWGRLVNPKVSRESVTAVLMHELTHAADKIKDEKGPIQGRIPTSDELDYTAYVNDPHEVRAHMREIYEEIRDIVTNVMQSPLAKDWGLGGTVERILRTNDTWRQIKPHLTRQSRNTILKGLVTAFEDDGLVG